MEIVYFTVAAVVLYFVSDWLVDRIEILAGRRFEYRSLLFLAILASLALVAFWLIRQIVA